MDPGSSAHAPSRREVLKAAACGLPLALASSTWPGTSLALDAAAENGFKPIRIPEWVHGVSRMAFVAPGEVHKAAKAGVQVVHGNAVWPYFPLRRDGGKLKPEEDRILRKFADDSHRLGMKLVLGLPPFPSVDLVKRHPDWRIHPDNAGSILKVEPREDNLGTRVGCNLGPWGDYLIEICVELLHDYHLDGYSFDGNYHPSICYCPACKNAYRQDRQRDLPAAVNLDELGLSPVPGLARRTPGRSLPPFAGTLEERKPRGGADVVDGERRPLRPFPEFATLDVGTDESTLRPADAGVVARRKQLRRQRGPGLAALPISAGLPAAGPVPRKRT